jgi:hypothetical protein
MAQFRKDTYNYLQDNKTLFEVVMIADQYGNLVGPSNPSGMAVDAFGRARSAQPITLFDSFNRYQVNGGFVTSNTATGNTTYDTNTSTVSLNIDTASGAKVVRETNKVFAYQPGKSLQILSTFVMDEAKAGLRQRVGYFNSENGVFLEQANTNVRFVVRSNITGTPNDTTVLQENWNIDPLDGTGPSKITLDLTKAQIFFTDIEWLGVGSVRCGFVINGRLIHCHTFHHANIEDSVYMTTACLPVRYEIENTAETDSASTLNQICSSVISEGGYELRGRPRTIGSSSLFDLPTSGTFYPVTSIRLKSTRMDGIVIPKNISLLGVGNNTRLHWKIVQDATITGGSWTSVGSDSAVEYNANTSATMSGGIDLVQGYVGINNQSNETITLDSGLFKFQLERNALANTVTTFTLAVSGAANGDDCLGAIMWEEIT